MKFLNIEDEYGYGTLINLDLVHTVRETFTGRSDKGSLVEIDGESYPIDYEELIKTLADTGYIVSLSGKVEK